MASGGFDNHPPATRGIYAPRDLFPLPPASLRRDPLESAKVRQASLDILKLAGVFAFIVATAFALSAGYLFLMFVKP